MTTTDRRGRLVDMARLVQALEVQRMLAADLEGTANRQGARATRELVAELATLESPQAEGCA